MKRHPLPFLTLISLVVACKSGAESEPKATEPVTLDIQTELQSCGVCHKPGENDLSGLSKADLLGKLKALRDGKAKHPSEFGQYTDAQLEEMAAGLATK